MNESEIIELEAEQVGRELLLRETNVPSLTNRELYEKLCEEQNVPLMMQPWWMDAVCAGKHWDVVLCLDSDGKVRAAMPYMVSKWLWIKYVKNPPMTQIQGIWLREDVIDSDVDSVCEELFGLLKGQGIKYYKQQYIYSSRAVEHLKKLGFGLRKRYIYRLPDLLDLDKVLDSFSKSKKQQLQKSLTLQADWQMTAEEFYRFYSSCMEMKKEKCKYTREFFLVLYTKALRLNKGHILRIRSIDGGTVAAAFLVWDNQTLYYQLPCYDVSKKMSGAREMLLWESVKLARKIDKQFDFGIITGRRMRHHYKEYGGAETKAYQIRKWL